MKITEEMKKEALERINEWECNLHDLRQTYYADGGTEGYERCDITLGIYKTIRAILQPSPQPDTVTISRESFERVREALNKAYMAPMLGEKCGNILKAIDLLNAEGKV